MAGVANTTRVRWPKLPKPPVRCAACEDVGFIDGRPPKLCGQCNPDEAARRVHVFRLYQGLKIGRSYLGRLEHQQVLRFTPARRAEVRATMERIARFFGFRTMKALFAGRLGEMEFLAGKGWEGLYVALSGDVDAADAVLTKAVGR